MIDQIEVLHSPFNINTHKETFMNYFEVIIHPDGMIEYAVPSHQLKLFLIYYEKITGEKIYYKDEDFYDKKWKFEMDNVPRKWYLDMIQYYTNKTGCIAVWDKRKQCPVEGMTSAQKNAIKLLKLHKLYKGE